MKKRFQIITTTAVILWTAATIFFVQMETTKTMNQIVELNKKMVSVIR